MLYHRNDILHHAGCKLARLVIGRDGLKQSRVMPMQQVPVHASSCFECGGIEGGTRTTSS